MTRFVGIDPSTKTGFVALDEDGQVLVAKELTGIGTHDPKRMATLIDEIMRHVRTDDIIAIEGFGFASQQAIQLGGIGWGVRMALLRRGLPYTEVAPNAVKKYVGVTGWIGESGNKKRLSGAQKKIVVMDAVVKEFGFHHKSDNVVDAYILAEVAKNIWTVKTGMNRPLNEGHLPKYQAEVLETILKSS